MEKITWNISLEEIKKYENCMSPSWEYLAKVVIDIQSWDFVIWWFLHVDEEDLLLDEWYEQTNLWWVNLYSSKYWTPLFIEYDSMINIRPNQNNRSRYVEDENIRNKIETLLLSKIKC